MTEALMSEIAHPAPDGWLKRFFLSLVILALLAGLLLVPWAVCWLTASGELDQEEVVARQAQGEFVLFGPGLAQDIMAYKLALYAAVKPEVVVLGSSRTGNVRAASLRAAPSNKTIRVRELIVVPLTLNMILLALPIPSNMQSMPPSHWIISSYLRQKSRMESFGMLPSGQWIFDGSISMWSKNSAFKRAKFPALGLANG